MNVDNGLEKIVPPLELCKKIPDGAFADSALIWHVQGSPVGYMKELERRDELHAERFGVVLPAPTLAEIMSALPKCVEYRWFDDGFYPSHPKHYAGDFADPSPTTAVLKLWLTLNAGEVKK